MTTPLTSTSSPHFLCPFDLRSLPLWYCGSASYSTFHGGQPAVSASAMKINGEPIQTPTGKQPYEVQQR